MEEKVLQHKKNGMLVLTLTTFLYLGKSYKLEIKISEDASAVTAVLKKADAYSMILSMRQHRNSRPATALWQQVRSIMPRQTRR